MSILRTNDSGIIFFDETLLNHMRVGNNTEIWSILGNENPCELSDSARGRTLLHFAAEYDNSRFAQQLLDLGADIDAQDQKKRTPLMLAVHCNKIQTVRVLVQANADIFILDVEGQCALSRAFGHDFNSDIAKAFIDRVTVESLTSSKYVASDVFHRHCPLYYFMPLKNPEVTRILLEKGSPVDAKIPFFQETALHRAAKLLNLESMKLLLEYNADVNTKSRIGRTPLAYIPVPIFNESETLEAVKMLVAAGAILIDYISRVSMVRELLTHGSREIIHTLLQREIDLTFEDKEGLTSLHYLAKNACADVLEELPKLDFDVDIRCREGRTMLHYAAQGKNPSSVKLLLNRGADVNARDHQQRTPLFAVVHQRNFDQSRRDPDDYSKDCVNCVEILLERDADPHFLVEGYIQLNNYQTFDVFLKVFTPVLAKIALNEVLSGRNIYTSMLNFIELFSQFKNTFGSIKLQLEEMKQIKIDNSVTLFDILTVGDNKISRLARNEKFVSHVTDLIKECTTAPYYLRRRLLQITHLVEFRQKYLPVINDVLRKFCNRSVDNIAEQIVDFLHRETWKELL